MPVIPTAEEMMRVVTLGRYLMWCHMQRDHYKEIKVTWETDFYDSMEMQRAFMYLSYWLAGFYVVCEGWGELKLSDPAIDALLLSPYLQVLRRYRNGVFHYQQDYFDARIKEAISLGDDFTRWVDESMGHMNRYMLEWNKAHLPLVRQVRGEV